MKIHPILFALLLSAPAMAQPLPNPRTGAALPTPPAQGNAVGDFKSGPKTGMAVRDGALSVVSSGNDPIFYSSGLPPMRGPYFIEFRMNSNLLGPMEIYWKTAKTPDFSGANKVSVGNEKPFDGKYRMYLIDLPESASDPLTQIRFDPGSGPGEALFEFIRIRSVTGKIWKEWKATN